MALFESYERRIDQIKPVMEKYGIKVSSIGSPIGKIDITADQTEHFALFMHTLDLADIFETKNIRMFSFYVPEGKGKEYKGKVFDRLGQFADYAKANNVVLLHENEKGIYGEKAKELLALIKKVCDGEPTKNEIYGNREIAIFKDGVTL